MKISSYSALAISIFLSSVIKRALGQEDFMEICSDFALDTPEFHFTCPGNSGQQDLDLCISNQNGELTGGNELANFPPTYLSTL